MHPVGSYGDGLRVVVVLGQIEVRDTYWATSDAGGCRWAFAYGNRRILIWVQIQRNELVRLIITILKLVSQTSGERSGAKYLRGAE